MAKRPHGGVKWLGARGGRAEGSRFIGSPKWSIGWFQLSELQETSMRSALFERLDELLDDPESMLRLAERINQYGLRGDGSIPGASDVDLPDRHRAALTAHATFFHKSYADGRTSTGGIAPFLEHEGFAKAACRLYGRPLLRPFAARANLLLPGQTLAFHTDPPEFRGINAEKDPAWLVVAMHHSGLFDDWRIPIATAIAWFGGPPSGGDFVFYPDGPYGRSVAVPATHNTAIVLDTDSVFHGVDRVGDKATELPPLPAVTELRYGGDGAWVLDDGRCEVARFTWEDLRFSVSWRARCFADEADERKMRDPARALTRERAVQILCDDLRSRGRIGEEAPDEAELARTIAAEYIKFPPAAPKRPRE